MPTGTMELAKDEMKNNYQYKIIKLALEKLFEVYKKEFLLYILTELLDEVTIPEIT